MTKQEKIAALATAMTIRTRHDGTDYHAFIDAAPDELRDLFLRNYDIHDLDYEIFSRGCDLVAEVYENDTDASHEKAEEMIGERVDGSASVYISDRLAYLNPSNEEGVYEILGEYGISSISDACAIWFDRQVSTAAVLINEWINA